METTKQGESIVECEIIEVSVDNQEYFLINALYLFNLNLSLRNALYLFNLNLLLRNGFIF